MIFSKIFRSIDAFGQPITLKLNGESKQQTILGGIASLFTLTLVIVFFYGQITTFIQRGNVTAIVTKQFKTQSEIQMGDPSQSIAIGFDNINHTSLFNISIVQNTLQNQVILNQTYFELEFCNQTVLTSLLNYNTDHKINQYLCIKQFLDTIDRPNQTISIGFNEEIKYEISIEISKCLENSKFCNYQETDNNTIYQVQLLFLNNIVNTFQSGDGSQFISQFIDDTYLIQFVPNTFTKDQQIYISQYNIYNDESLYYLSDIDEFHVLSADFQDSKQIIQAGQDNYARFIFKKNQFEYTITRSNGKITDLLAKLGGFIKIVIFILGILLSFYNGLQFYINLANKIYEFSFQNINQRKQSEALLFQFNTILKKKPSDKLFNGINQSIYFGQKQKSSPIPTDILPYSSDHIILTTERNDKKNEINEEQQKTSVIDNLIEYHTILAKRMNCKNPLDYFQKQVNLIMNRSQNLSLTLKLFLNQILCQKVFKNNVNVILFNKAMIKITSRLDISHILQKLEDLDKLKTILLTQSQLQIFNFSPKELLMPDQDQLTFDRQILEEKARLSSPKKISLQASTIFNQKDQNEITIYQNIYRAYDDIINIVDEGIYIQPKDINQELIKKLGPEIQTLFKVSKLIDYKQLQLVRRKIMTRRNAVVDENIEITNLMKQFYE